MTSSSSFRMSRNSEFSGSSAKSSLTCNSSRTSSSSSSHAQTLAQHQRPIRIRYRNLIRKKRRRNPRVYEDRVTRTTGEGRDLVKLLLVSGQIGGELLDPKLFSSLHLSSSSSSSEISPIRFRLEFRSVGREWKWRGIEVN